MLEKAPVKDRGKQCAALAEEGDAARARNVLGKRCIQSGPWIHDAQAIGANQAHGTATQFALDFALQLDARSSTFLEARGNDYRRAHAGINALTDDGGYRGRG